MSYGTVQAEKMTTESGYSLGAGNASSFKNRIINGHMEIDQRRNGASFSGTGTVVEFLADRFFCVINVSGLSSTLGQSTVAPAGFTNSIVYTATTGASAASADRAQITHRIEGFNIGDLAWGTASAKPVTVSFWVRSSRTGQFGGAIQNDTGNRSYPFTYTINAANTWEYETITIPGETTGTWLTNNGAGIQLTFDIGMGSSLLGTAGAWASADLRGATGDTSVVSTTGATWYVTGVQLEVGTVATSFDWRPYGTELALCQRYYQQRGGNSPDERIAVGFVYITTQGRFIYPTRVVMRASPTLTVSSGTDFNIEVAGAAITSTSLSLDQPSPEIIAINCNVASGLTAGAGCQLQARNSNARIMFSAEL